MRIAILDPRIQAPGLVKLFPEADYFVVGHNGEYDLGKTPDRFHRLYGFGYREDLDAITDDRYDALFIVYACYDFRDKRRADVQHHLKKILEVLNKSKFKKVVVFANDDNAFDPVATCPFFKADIWFKRNCQSDVKYPSTVVPFPFVLFGTVCPLWRVLTESHTSSEKQDRIIWAGCIGGRTRPPYRHKKYLTRRKLFKSRLFNYITTVDAPNDIYLYGVSHSKFALDINGAGDPNYRTFELLTTDTLMLQQFKYMIWPFDAGDAFSEETIYKTPDEFIGKLERLRADPALYERCLANQKHIKQKYFQAGWLRDYLLKHIGSL
jgi:hypothetical protein